LNKGGRLRLTNVKNGRMFSQTSYGNQAKLIG